MATRKARLTRARAAASALVLLTVAAVVVAGVFVYRYVDGRLGESARSDSVAAAKKYATTMFGYDPGNVADHVAKSKEVVTGPAKSQYDKLIAQPIQGVNEDFVAGVRKQQVASQATIQDAGVVTSTQSSATVLIFMNQSVTRNGKDLVRVDPSRLTFAMVHRDGRWLINSIDIITDDSFRSLIGQATTPPSPGATPTPIPQPSGSAPAPASESPSPEPSPAPVPTP